MGTVIAKSNIVPVYARHILKAYGYKKLRFFYLRYLLNPAAMRDWLSFVDGLPLGGEFASWNFISKPLRAYMQNGLKMRQRIELIKGHYNLLAQKFPAPHIAALLHDCKIPLAEMHGKSGSEYNILLNHHARYRREGELSIVMRKLEDDETLAVMTFTIGKKPDGRKFLLIGGVQGASANAGKEIVVRATRDLNGLRPKNAVLNAVYAFADVIGVQVIEAVSMQNHPVKATNSRKQKNFFADYDSFWQEITHGKNAEGNFILPQNLPRKKLEEVPSKKKKDWLKRQEYVANMAASCVVILNTTMNLAADISAVG